MTANDTEPQHTLLLEQITDPWAVAAGHRVHAMCEQCHNPDADGVGRADLMVRDDAQAAEWFAQHIAEADGMCPSTGEPHHWRPLMVNAEGKGLYGCVTCTDTHTVEP